MTKNGGRGITFLNWSNKYGTPRIGHFIGMHALQVLPFLAYYVFKNVKLSILAGLFYSALAVITLIQALAGKPFWKM